MKPFYAFSDQERDDLKLHLKDLGANPYQDYLAFQAVVRKLIDQRAVPASLIEACGQIRRQRERAETYAHVVANCPLDDEIPVFDQDNPVWDKYKKKSTYVGEGLLELVSQITGTPLLAYATRNNGDFFHDVYADNRFNGTQTQKTDGELFFHNDRTAHPVRADYLALLGMRCPTDELIYTGYVDGRELLKNISEDNQALLRQPDYVTPFDEYSRASNENQSISDRHTVLENEHSFRYYETRTRPADPTSPRHYAALMELRDALVKAHRQDHRIQDGDLFIFANQDGLHNRQKLDIQDARTARLRWLLKTYAFRDEKAAELHSDKWVAGVPGRVRD